MTLGALGTIHFHLTARRWEASRQGRGWVWLCHAAAVLGCAAACLSNAVGAVIPLLIVAFDLTARPRPKWTSILAATAPLGVIAAATIAIKRLDPEAGRMLAPEAPVFSAAWLMLVLNVYWLNLRSLVWPSGLACDYGRVFPGTFLNAEVILGLVAAILTVAALGGLGAVLRRWGRGRLLLFALLWFVLALAPTSQVLPHQVHRADRFLYLPLAGLALAAALALGWLEGRLTSRASAGWILGSAFAVLVALAARSEMQIPTWRNSLALWENCVRVMPRYAIARRALADQLFKAGQFQQAERHYAVSLDLEPDRVDTLANFAALLATCPETERRNYGLAVRLAQRAYTLCKGSDPWAVRTLSTAYSEQGTDYLNKREIGDAVECFRSAIKTDPGYEVPRFKLAELLADCPDARFRDPAEAVRQAEEGIKLVPQADAARMMILAQSYAAAGRYEEAAAAIQRAFHLPEVAGNRQLAAELQRRWNKYRQLGWNQ
jgi:tetratricopeptide (TPR) repeat protein